MKEMLQSKVMITFVVFVLGFTYLNSLQMKNLEEASETENLIVMNA